MVNSELVERIERIEFEVELLKKSLKNKPIRMKGRLKGIRIDEEDFKEAEESVFKSIVEDTKVCIFWALH